MRLRRAPSGEIIDPYGGNRTAGQVLRHVSEAFVEDRCGFFAWLDSRPFLIWASALLKKR